VALWQAILVAVGGNAALLLVLGFLGRSLFGVVIAKDLEAFKSRLAITAAEHQVTFAALHARRAEVVSELYKLLVRAVLEASRFANPLEMSHQPDRKQKYVNATNATTAFYLYFDENRIYLPTPLCDQLDQFASKLHVPTVTLGFHEQYEQGQGDPQNERTKAWVAAWHSVEKEIPPVRQALEAEFRKMLGVGSGQPN